MNGHPLDWRRRLEWDFAVSFGAINARIDDQAAEAVQEIQELTNKALERNANALLRSVRVPILTMADLQAQLLEVQRSLWMQLPRHFPIQGAGHVYPVSLPHV